MRKKMTDTPTKEITEPKWLLKNAMISAIYILITVINPNGWGPLQFRISEMLMVLPILDRRYTLGAMIGVSIANFFSPLGIIDVAVGLLCCLAYLITPLTTNPYIPSTLYALFAGIFVGLELKITAAIPFWPSFISVSLTTGVIVLFAVWLFNRIKLIDRLNLL